MEVATQEVPKECSDNNLPENSTKENTPTPLRQDPPKKSKKEERSKKDDKNVEQFMKSLNSVPTLDEKLSLVCKKYVQTADDNKKLQFYVKQSDKRYALIVKEKEQLQHEYNKTILVKSKLENLCRELQKQNKAVKEESLLKIREEEERRKETQTKFQNTLSEITTLLQQNNEKNAKLRDDNISMTEKFKSVVQQYQLREQQVDKMAKQMTLESQLNDAKLQKASLEHQAEKERMLAELETLKVTLAQYKAKNMEMLGTESALKGQLAVYTDKYDEFQSALVRSNQVFGGFKEQMEKMSKKIQKLEKESLSWKKRWETSQTALLDMCGERQASEERAAAAGRHLQQMQSLCRTMQAERTVLLNTLKENNIERPPLPTPPPAPAPLPVHTPASDAKVDAMAANCAQLRQSLAHLQSQLNVLTNKKEESPKPEKPKKSKSKKNKSEKAQKVSQEKIDVEETRVETDVKEDVVESQPNTDESPVQNGESSDEKIDSKTMESLIQAINLANINLCNLSEDTDKQEGETEKIENAESNEETVEKLQSVLLPNVESSSDTKVIDTLLEDDKVSESVLENHIDEIISNDIVEKVTTKEDNIEELSKDVKELIIAKEVDKLVNKEAEKLIKQDSALDTKPIEVDSITSNAAENEVVLDNFSAESCADVLNEGEKVITEEIPLSAKS